MNIETLLLPPWIPMILALVASLLMLTGQHHTRNIKLLHFLGRFYVFIVYFFATFNLFGLELEDITAFARAGVVFLMLEEITVWLIEMKWPVKRG